MPVCKKISNVVFVILYTQKKRALQGKKNTVLNILRVLPLN